MSFCIYFKLDYLPVSIDTICLYCQFLSRSLTPQSVQNYISGVKFLHLIAGLPFPHTQSFELKVTLRGIARLAQHCPIRAPPVTPFILREVAAISDFSSTDDIVFLTAFLFAFFLFACISNIVPLSSKSFDLNHVLCRKDISLTPYGLLVTFHWTKTIQFGQRKLTIPLVRIPGSPLCPVHMYHIMCSLIPAPPSSPTFVLPSSTGTLIPLTKAKFVLGFRQRLARAGVPKASSFRGHSFRRGGASWAFHTGVPGELIQIFGDWSSEAYKSYLELSHSSKLLVASRMTSAL